MRNIKQNYLPFAPWMSATTDKLPGIQPLGNAPLFWVDDAYSNQMSYRDELIRIKREEVFCESKAATQPSFEILEEVLKFVSAQKGFSVKKNLIKRLDGTEIKIGLDHPLIEAASIVQEDLLILEKNTDGDIEHNLIAGVLCFPAFWKLSEKFGHGLNRIHQPVSGYDYNIALRVQRMFDLIRVGKPLWRANWFIHDSPELFTPQSENKLSESSKDYKEGPFWVRVERQVLFKLQKSGSLVFSIHTFIVDSQSLTKEQISGLKKRSARK